MVDKNGQAGLTDLGARQRTEEAARVLGNALAEAGHPNLARLVVTEPVAEGPPTVTLLPMRPDEARALAALIDKAGGSS
jgi:hypothetical protein